MDDAIRRALETDRLIDITTTGRKTGRVRRLEIWFHNVEGTVYITGLPGKRHWYANLLTDPSFIFHLKESAQADLSATAIPIINPVERRAILEVITHRLNARQPLEEWVGDSPLIRVSFDG